MKLISLLGDLIQQHYPLWCCAPSFLVSLFNYLACLYRPLKNQCILKLILSYYSTSVVLQHNFYRKWTTTTATKKIWTYFFLKLVISGHRQPFFKKETQKQEITLNFDQVINLINIYFLIIIKLS